MNSITVTKIDAARRQLETAVLLYFNDRDPLAIHTLAAAAQGVLEPLTKRAGKTTPLHTGDLPPDLEEKVRKALRGPQNFLKHSDRDPDATMEFSPALTEFILYNSVAAYMGLTGDYPILLGAFWQWCVANYPILVTAAGPEIQELLQQRQQIIAAGRSSFLNTYLTQNVRLRPSEA